MSSLATKTPTPKGPAADPKYPSSLAPSNPYNFPPHLLAAGKLAPKITTTHIYFFGYEGTDPHICFQQWFPSPFTGPHNPYTGDSSPVTFPTAEHFMMYHKALLMHDVEIAAQILAPENSHPSRAKALGREVRNFDLEVWKAESDRVVTEGNVRKFGQDEELKSVLLGTGERVIVEASPDDRIWGIGFDSEQAEGREAEWGNNGLGKALMAARERTSLVVIWAGGFGLLVTAHTAAAVRYPVAKAVLFVVVMWITATLPQLMHANTFVSEEFSKVLIPQQ